MIYNISNKQQKTSAKGTQYVSATLTDEQGIVYDRINAFRGEFIGDTVEGTLVKNGDFWNFEAKVVHTANIPPRGQNFASKAQETKQAMIEESQGRREQGIANSGSITNATNLVVAMINAGFIPSTGSEEDVQTAVYKYIKWYRAIYANPDLTQKEVEHVALPPF